MVLFSGLPRRQFSVHFALLIAAESTLGALLEPLFGLFQKVNSPKFGCMGSRKLQLFLAAPCGERDIADTRRRTVPSPLELRPASLVVTR
jgi:hypothetical protein